jgi:hypothetical protein
MLAVALAFPAIGDTQSSLQGGTGARVVPNAKSPEGQVPPSSGANSEVSALTDPTALPAGGGFYGSHSFQGLQLPVPLQPQPAQAGRKPSSQELANIRAQQAKLASQQATLEEFYQDNERQFREEVSKDFQNASTELTAISVDVENAKRDWTNSSSTLTNSLNGLRSLVWGVSAVALALLMMIGAGGIYLMSLRTWAMEFGSVLQRQRDELVQMDRRIDGIRDRTERDLATLAFRRREEVERDQKASEARPLSHAEWFDDSAGLDPRRSVREVDAGAIVSAFNELAAKPSKDKFEEFTRTYRARAMESDSIWFVPIADLPSEGFLLPGPYAVRNWEKLYTPLAAEKARREFGEYYDFVNGGSLAVQRPARAKLSGGVLDAIDRGVLSGA